MLYWIRYSQLFWISVIVGIILILSCVQWLIVPLILPIQFVNVTTWSLRFRIISIESLYIPHYLLSILLLSIGWPRQTNWKNIFKIQKNSKKNSNTIELQLYS